MSDARCFRVDPYKIIHVIQKDWAWQRASTKGMQVTDTDEVFPNLDKEEHTDAHVGGPRNALSESISFDRLLEFIAFKQHPTTSPPQDGKKMRLDLKSKPVLHELRRIAK